LSFFFWSLCFLFYQKKKDKRTRRVWRYQSGNQNPYIEEEQKTQWPEEKGLKDKKSLKIPKG
jgi:hypothetical protein